MSAGGLTTSCLEVASQVVTWNLQIGMDTWAAGGVSTFMKMHLLWCPVSWSLLLSGMVRRNGRYYSMFVPALLEATHDANCDIRQVRRTPMPRSWDVPWHVSACLQDFCTRQTSTCLVQKHCSSVHVKCTLKHAVCTAVCITRCMCGSRYCTWAFVVVLSML